MTVRINALDGQTKSMSVDAGLLAKDVGAKLALKMNLKDHHSFALYQLVDNNWDLGTNKLTTPFENSKQSL